MGSGDCYFGGECGFYGGFVMGVWVVGWLGCDFV